MVCAEARETAHGVATTISAQTTRSHAAGAKAFVVGEESKRDSESAAAGAALDDASAWKVAVGSPARWRVTRTVPSPIRPLASLKSNTKFEQLIDDATGSAADDSEPESESESEHGHR